MTAQPALERALIELLALERELTELEYVRRADALERVSDAVRVLGELGSADGILPRAAGELGLGSQFDRVLISEVAGDLMSPLALWSGAGESAAGELLSELQRAPIRLAYPLVEAEVARRRGVALVTGPEGPGAPAGGRAPEELVQTLGLRSYVVAALSAQNETIGLVHADAGLTGRGLDELDVEVVAKFAQGLSGVLERAVLRHTLELHRAELQSAEQWMSGRLSSLAEDRAVRPSSEAGRRMIEQLTPRELDVLRLMARGHTNLKIAEALVVREGTVKYHVKNVLRKLGATSRADAVARFVRSAAPVRQT
jgi:LuxR family transcriptional regulator, regulator of acetate metabolism